MKNLKKLGLPKNSRLLKDAEMKSIMGGWDSNYDDPPKCGGIPLYIFLLRHPAPLNVAARAMSQVREVEHVSTYLMMTALHHSQYYMCVSAR